MWKSQEMLHSHDKFGNNEKQASKRDTIPLVHHPLDLEGWKLNQQVWYWPCGQESEYGLRKLYK